MMSTRRLLRTGSIDRPPLNWSIFAVALPSGTSGARLNDTVTACSCPWWLTEVGPTVRLTVEKAESVFQTTLQNGNPVIHPAVTLLNALAGSERAIDESAAPIRDLQGRITGCLLVVRDVTERRRQENLLREGERNVGELAQLTGYTSANVSRHLTLLAPHGLLARESRGHLYARECCANAP